MNSISQQSKTLTEGLVLGLTGIMHVFPGFRLEDFYGTPQKPPMLASQFFGMCGLVNFHSNQINKAQKKNK